MDSDWEGVCAKTLEELDEVDTYVKNLCINLFKILLDIYVYEVVSFSTCYIRTYIVYLENIWHI